MRFSASTLYWAVAANDEPYRVPTRTAQRLIGGRAGSEVPLQWCRVEDYGLLLVGVVMLMQDGNLRAVVSTAVVPRNVRPWLDPPDMQEIDARAWRHLAIVILMHAREGSLKLDDLAAFLPDAFAPLPYGICELAEDRSPATIQALHQSIADDIANGEYSEPIWDLRTEQVVELWNSPLPDVQRGEQATQRPKK